MGKTAMQHTDLQTIDAITGVYHADGGLVGELRYVVGKLRGTAHCALCDITHGVTGKKAGFSACELRLPVPMHLVHLNERSREVQQATEGQTPCVVAHTANGVVMLLGSRELDALGGSIPAFEAALDSAMAERSLRW